MSLRPDAPATLEERTFAEVVEVLCVRTRRNLLVSMFGMGFFVAMLWGRTPTWQILGWAAMHTLLTGVRLLQIRHWLRERPSPAATQRWVRGFIATAALAGVLWALPGSLLLPPATDPARVVVLIALLGGVATIASFALSPVWVSYAAFVAPLMIPPMLVLGEWLSTGSLVLLVGFVVLLLSTFYNARRHGEDIARAIRLRLTLEDTVAELERSRAEAERASQAKSQFLANVSHEIRTPMNGVLGMSQLLLRRATDAQARRNLETIHRSGTALLRIINDVLDFSKIEAGKLELVDEDFDLQQLLADVRELHREPASTRGLALRLELAADLPRRVRGDAQRLRQVLDNLVGNGIKFTEQGGVTIAARAAGPGRVAFAVSDTGAGVAPGEAERIFEAFSQGDASAARRFGGTGLGLAICRQLVQLMGGAIGVAAQPGGGARFAFELPLAAVAALPAAAPGPAAALPLWPLGGRVLLAEDNPVNREVALQMLGEWGVEVEVAVDGQEACDKALGGRYDLILMDCQMPVMDGPEAARRIRAAARAASGAVPIVAVTASAIAGDRERFLAAGMNDYLAKPYRDCDLHAMLARWLPAARRCAS